MVSSSFENAGIWLRTWRVSTFLNRAQMAKIALRIILSIWLALLVISLLGFNFPSVLWIALQLTAAVLGLGVIYALNSATQGLEAELDKLIKDPEIWVAQNHLIDESRGEISPITPISLRLMLADGGAMGNIFWDIEGSSDSLGLIIAPGTDGLFLIRIVSDEEEDLDPARSKFEDEDA